MGIGPCYWQRMWGGAVSACRAVVCIHFDEQFYECHCSIVHGGHVILKPSHTAACHRRQGSHIRIFAVFALQALKKHTKDIGKQ